MDVLRAFGKKSAAIDDKHEPIVSTSNDSATMAREGSENKSTSKETNSEAVNTTLPDNDHRLQHAGEFVIKQSQEAGKFVIEKGEEIWNRFWRPVNGNEENSVVLSEDQVRKTAEELPAMDSVAGLVQMIPAQLPDMQSTGDLKHQILSAIQYSNSIKDNLSHRQRFLKGETANLVASTVRVQGDEQGQGAGIYVIKKGQDLLKGYGFSFGGLKNKKPGRPSEDQVLDIESLARLKDQIQAAIQQYNSAKDSVKSIHDALNMASA